MQAIPPSVTAPATTTSAPVSTPRPASTCEASALAHADAMVLLFTLLLAHRSLSRYHCGLRYGTTFGVRLVEEMRNVSRSSLRRSSRCLVAGPDHDVNPGSHEQSKDKELEPIIVEQP